MKSIKKYLMYFVFCLSGLLIFNNSVLAADCDNYACAECVYENGSIKYNYDIKSNGDGTLQIDFTFSVPNGFRGSIKSVVEDSYFINSDTNKIQCYPIYVQSNGMNPPTYTIYKSNATGRKQITASSNSTNNNNTVANDYKLCTFKDTVTTKTNASCNVTITNNEITDIDCGTFQYNSALSDIEDVDFSKNCDDISLYMYCHVNQGYCTLNKNASFGNTTEGSNTETGNVTNSADYTCSYTGKINGQSLIISKYDGEWKVTYPNGNNKSFTYEGSNTFPTSACEDVFYITNNDNVKITAVKNDDKAENVISIFCYGYGNEVEQFCQSGLCKISNPLCGSSNNDGNNINAGGCPWELRAIIIFLKKVAFNTVQIFVPILLIVMGTIDFVKAIASVDDKGNKEAISKFIKRCLAAIMVFFIGTIVTIVMDMFAKTDVGEQSDWKTCWQTID